MLDNIIETVKGLIPDSSGLFTPQNIGKALAYIVFAGIIIFLFRLLKSHPVLLMLIIAVLGVLVLKGTGTF